MAAADGGDMFATEARKSHGALEFAEGARADVEGGLEVEGSRPGGLDVIWGRAKGNGDGVGFGELGELMLD